MTRRWEWFEGQLDLDPDRLVFIDETWASTNMARTRGRPLPLWPMISRQVASTASSGTGCAERFGRIGPCAAKAIAIGSGPRAA